MAFDHLPGLGSWYSVTAPNFTGADSVVLTSLWPPNGWQLETEDGL
jgi:hypothetical protein